MSRHETPSSQEEYCRVAGIYFYIMLRNVISLDLLKGVFVGKLKETRAGPEA